MSEETVEEYLARGGKIKKFGCNFKDGMVASIILLPLFLSGCWFVILPIGPIIRAVQGPRLCVSQDKSVGNKLKAPNGKMAVITKLHGVDPACLTPAFPILANISFKDN